MALSLTVDFQSSPRVITIAAPTTSATVQELVDGIRAAEDTVEAMYHPFLINAVGKQDLGDGVFVGITAILQNARVAFEARGGPTFEQCFINGGNFVAVDEDQDAINPIESTAYTQVIVENSTSAALIEGSGGDVDEMKIAILTDALS